MSGQQISVDIIVENLGSTDVSGVRLSLVFPAWFHLLKGRDRISIPVLRRGEAAKEVLRAQIASVSQPLEDSISVPRLVYDALGGRKSAPVSIPVAVAPATGSPSDEHLRLELSCRQPTRRGETTTVVVAVRYEGSRTLRQVDLQLEGAFSGDSQRSVVLTAGAGSATFTVQFLTEGFQKMSANVAGVTSGGGRVSGRIESQLFVEENRVSTGQTINIQGDVISSTFGPNSSVHSGDVIAGPQVDDLREILRQILSAPDIGWSAHSLQEERQQILSFVNDLNAHPDHIRAAVRSVLNVSQAVVYGVLGNAAYDQLLALAHR